MNLSNKEKTLLFVVGIILITVLGVQFLIRPAFSRMQALQVELQTVEQQQFETNQLLSKLNTIDQDIDIMLEKTVELAAPFFTVTDVENIHKWVMDLIRQNNLEVTNMNIGPHTIQSVDVYKIEEKDNSYAIGDYYHNMVNATQGNLVEEEKVAEQVTTSPVQEDEVIKIEIQLAIKGTKGQIINFVNQFNTLEKHAIAKTFSIATYNVDDAKQTGVTLEIYSIHKEEDDMLNYPFR